MNVNIRYIPNLWYLITARLAAIGIVTALLSLWGVSLSGSSVSADPIVTGQIIGFSDYDVSRIQPAIDDVQRQKHHTIQAILAAEPPDRSLSAHLAPETILIYFDTLNHQVFYAGIFWNGLSKDVRTKIKADVKVENQKNDYASAVIVFAHDLIHPPSVTFWDKHHRFVNVVGILVGGTIIVVIISQLVTRPKKLSVGQSYNKAELREHTLGQLNKYSLGVLHNADEGIRNYGIALHEAQEQLGNSAVVEFEQAYYTAKNVLSAAHEKRQYLDTNNSLTDDQRKQILSEFITELQSTEQQLSHTAKKFNEIRKEFLAAPDFLAQLRVKMIELTRRILTSKEIFIQLEKDFAPSVLVSLDHNIPDAEDLAHIAQVNIDKSDIFIQQGSPEVLQSSHIASNALGKAADLLNAIDNAQINIQSALLDIPQKITDAQQLAETVQHFAHERAISHPQLTTALDDINTAISCAIEKQKTDPLDAQAQLLRASTKLNAYYHQLEEKEQEKSVAQNQLRNAIDNAKSYISQGSDYISCYSQAIDSTPRTKLSEAESLAAQAAQALDPYTNINAVIAAQQTAINASDAAKSALLLAQSQVNRNRGNYNLLNSGSNSGSIAGHGLASFFGAFMGSSVANSLHDNSWNYSDSWGSDSWGDIGSMDSDSW